MDMNNMGHHITNNDMVKKHWVPLLTEKAKEAWDRVEDDNLIRSPPPWPQFEKLLEIEGEKAHLENVTDAGQPTMSQLYAKYTVHYADHGNVGTLDTGNNTSNQQRLVETIIATPATKNIPWKHTRP
jgi:hypothetical protein